MAGGNSRTETQRDGQHEEPVGAERGQVPVKDIAVGEISERGLRRGARNGFRSCRNRCSGR